MSYDWNFQRLLPYSRAFFYGTFTTLQLFILVVFFGTIFGLLLGLALRNRAVRILLYPVIDVIRALPPLVLILFSYYLFTQQIIGTTLATFTVCVIAMSTNLAAFTADVVRAAIANVPSEALDAGRALGMSEKQLTIHVILPHVFREIIPVMAVLYVGMLKMTSLASIISVRELVYTAQTVIANISRSLEAWTVVGAIYVCLVLPAMYFVRWLEKWAGRGHQLTRDKTGKL